MAGVVVGMQRGCVDDNEAAAFVEHGLDEAAAAAVEAHLDVCAGCRAQVGALAGLLADDAGPPPRASGSQIGRYIVGKRIGRGGMGVVLEARDPELDRRIAIKVIRPDLADPQNAERLLEEARAMARVSHPNVVAVLDAGRDGDEVFIVMDFVEGPNLAQWLRAETRDPAAILDLFAQAGRGLARAHDEGIVHGDFKPANVLVGEDGRARVTDFGLARFVGAAPTLGLAGTLAYFSPEQARGESLTPACDQYALCIALWEALAGARPFDGAESLEARLELQRRGDLSTPSEPALRRGPVRALRRGLAFDPADRHPSLHDLLAALRPHARARGVAAVVTASVLVAAGVFAATTGTAPQDACAVAAAPMASIWNDDAAAAVRSAFAGTQRPDAPAAFERVDRRLDTYAEQWSRIRTETCEAARTGDAPERSDRPSGDPSRDGRALDMRAACLDQRLTEVATTIEILRGADATIVARAVEMTANLGRVDDCVLADLPGFPQPPPGIRDRIKAARSGIARAEALRRAAQHAEAIAVLSELGPHEDYPPLHAELKLALGRARLDAGEPKDARALLLEAALIAEGARHDEVAAEAWIDLLFISTEGLQDLAQAREWATRAEAAVDRYGTPATRAHLEHRLGLLEEDSENYDAARNHLSRSLELWRELDPEHPRVPGVVQALGGLAEREGDFKTARARDTEAVELWTQSLGADHPQTAKAQTNLGVVLKDMGEYAESRRLYEDALTKIEGTLGREHPATATVSNNLGVVLRRLGEFDASVAAHQRAVEIREKHFGPEAPHLVSALGNLGAAALMKEDGDVARPALDRAITLAQRHLPPEHTTLANTLGNRGMLSLAEGRLDDAVTDLKRSTAIWAARGSDDPRRANPLRALGETRLEQGRVAEAVALLEEARALVQGGPDAAAVDRARVLFALARALQARGATARAQALAAEALQTFAGAGGVGVKWATEVRHWLEAR